MSHIFLSYGREDLEFMRRLRTDMSAAGLDVWTDETGLEPGTPAWETTIQRAIESASCLVVLLSPASKDSTWVTREIGHAESYGIRIFPILIRGDQRTSVPLRLTSTQRIDARQDYEAAIRTLIQALRRHRKGGTPDLVAPPPNPQASPKPLAIKRLVIAGVAALLLIAVLFGVAVLVPIVIEELAKRFEGDSVGEVTPSAVPQVTESSGAEDETRLTPPGVSELQWITSAETSALSGPNGAFWDKYQAGADLPGLYLRTDDIRSFGDYLEIYDDQTFVMEFDGVTADGSWILSGDQLSLTVEDS